MSSCHEDWDWRQQAIIDEGLHAGEGGGVGGVAEQRPRLDQLGGKEGHRHGQQHDRQASNSTSEALPERCEAEQEVRGRRIPERRAKRQEPRLWPALVAWLSALELGAADGRSSMTLILAGLRRLRLSDQMA